MPPRIISETETALPERGTSDALNGEQARDLGAQVLALASQVQELRREIKGLSLAPIRTPKQLLSLRETAKRLGIGRASTLGELVTGKKIKTVKVNGHLRVPLSEVERLAREGFDTRQS